VGTKHRQGGFSKNIGPAATFIKPFVEREVQALKFTESIMKKLFYLLTCLGLWSGMTFAQGAEVVNLQDSTGMPGDHFSLAGALQQFKEATSLEDFEQRLNTEANGVNNLDLNQDGETDYVRVEDHVEGNSHAIVLQVPVNETESQDIAVIELEKNGESSALLQILGDEEVYGEQVIVEPTGDDVEKSSGRGPAMPEISYLPAVVVNVWGWPTVRFVYAPAYRPYVSPWKWRHYPGWYRPWRPAPWRRHYVRCAPFRVHYRPVTTHRVVVAHGVYRPHRHTSVVVVNRYKPARANYQKRHVTVVKGPRGGTKAVVVHKGPRGGRRR
jgi:hypothetical protein